MANRPERELREVVTEHPWFQWSDSYPNFEKQDPHYYMYMAMRRLFKSGENTWTVNSLRPKLIGSIKRSGGHINVDFAEAACKFLLMEGARRNIFVDEWGKPLNFGGSFKKINMDLDFRLKHDEKTKVYFEFLREMARVGPRSHRRFLRSLK